MIELYLYEIYLYISRASFNVVVNIVDFQTETEFQASVFRLCTHSAFDNGTLYFFFILVDNMIVWNCVAFAFFKAIHWTNERLNEQVHKLSFVNRLLLFLFVIVCIGRWMWYAVLHCIFDKQRPDSSTHTHTLAHSFTYHTHSLTNPLAKMGEKNLWWK